MKLFKYSLIAALALSGALCACDDDNDYAPGAAVSGDEVYFPEIENTTIDIPDQATSIDIPVARIKDAADVTVNVSSTVIDAEGQDASTVFTVPSQVTFKSGEKETPLTIAVDFAKVVADQDYTLTVNLEGNNTTPYGASSCTYTLRYAPWTEWEFVPGEEGVYTFAHLSSIKGDYEVGIVTRRSMINPDNIQYATVGPFSNGINFVYSVNMAETVEVDGKNYPKVSIQTYIPGLTNGASDEHFIWMDTRTWIAEFWGLGWDRVDQVMERNNFGPSYLNTDTGLFYLDVAVVSDDPALPGTSSAYGVGYEYLQLPGYKSYSISFSYSGNYVDMNDQEYAIVNAYKSEDVTSYIYDIFDGKLNDDQIATAIETMKADENLEAVTASNTNLAFNLTEDGTYTVVGIGRDASGEDVCTAAYSFDFNTVRGAEKWTSLGYCEYTDGFINCIYGTPTLTWDVEIQESNETPGLYRLVDPYKDWAAKYSNVEYLAGKYYLNINVQNPEQVYITTSKLGVVIDPSYGQAIVSSTANGLLENGISPDVIAANNCFGKLEDGIITFPTGRLLFIEENEYDGEGYYYANTDPDNNTKAETGTYDPFWGTGTFCVDMSGLAASASKVKSSKAPIYYDFVKNGEKFKSGFTIKTKTLKTLDPQVLQDYRKNNPRQLVY